MLYEVSKSSPYHLHTYYSSRDNSIVCGPCLVDDIIHKMDRQQTKKRENVGQLAWHTPHTEHIHGRDRMIALNYGIGLTQLNV